MNALPDANPIWWDREFDDDGKPIRIDVRQAARDLWPDALGRVRRSLIDLAETAELMEATVFHISHHLDRKQIPSFDSRVPSLVSLHFSQKLRRHLGRLGRIGLVGDHANMELYASVTNWAEHIDRQIDFEKIIGYLDKTSRTVVAMRLQEHEWQLIGEKMGVPPATLRSAFWKNLREVLSRLGFRNGWGKKGKKE